MSDELETQIRLINKEKNRMITFRDSLNVAIQNMIDIEIKLKGLEE